MWIQNQYGCVKIITITLCSLIAFVWITESPVMGIDTVPIGNPGNFGELSGAGAGGAGPDRICGGVDYEYNIGKYEVTAGQYTEFLNAVAATDTYELYSTDMWNDPWGYACKIQRNGTSGSYTYSVESDWANRPVNYISWGDAARFANWLHNGQPTGPQDLTTTEDGSYFLNGAMNNTELIVITREDDATWVIPSEDEWYKAAFYEPQGGTGIYWDYPIGTDVVPSNDLVDPDPGNNATFYDGDLTIGSPYYRTEVGAHEHSNSPYETFDQGGNVWEWNEAVLFNNYRGRRGGSFDQTSWYLFAPNRQEHAWPTVQHHAIGFRVVEIPGQGTPCPGDLTGDDQVNIDDIFAVLGLWGDCPDPCPPYCTGDLTEDCTVNIDDIFAILGQWGPCE